MCPRDARISEANRTACAKSPVKSVSAVRNRLPKLWPFNPRPSLNRYSNMRLNSASSSDRATIQARISPGGRTKKSRRRRPELPPSSVTVTIAVIETAGRSGPAHAFRPLSSVDKPLPPPIDTIRSGPRSDSEIGCEKSSLEDNFSNGLMAQQFVEVGVGPGGRAVRRLYFNGLRQVSGRRVHIALQTFNEC